MNGVISRLLFKRFPYRSAYYLKRNESLHFHYDLTEEITITSFKKVLIIGINLPDTSNSLNDSALIKLNDSLRDFDCNDQYTAAVLHGIGGNFCSGILKSACRANAEEIIKTMNKIKKPTVATVTGYTTFFGFQLAMMCDFRIMESSAVLGLGCSKEKDEVFPIVCERILNLTNLATALDVVLAGTSLNCTEAVILGLVNRKAECGTALGNSINFAKCIAKYPMEEIISSRKLIYSILQKSRSNLN